MFGDTTWTINNIKIMHDDNNYKYAEVKQVSLD